MEYVTLFFGLARPWIFLLNISRRGWELVQLSKTSYIPNTSTSSVITTTTTTPSFTTTTIPDNKNCPLIKTLGDGNPTLEKFRTFRDSQLSQSAVGRRIIRIYYNNAGSLSAALDRSPLLRGLTRRFFNALSSRMGSKE